MVEEFKIRGHSMKPIQSLMLASMLFWLIPTLAKADPPFNPPGPPFNPPGPPPWVDVGRAVPIPGTALLFGLGFIALPWLRSKAQNDK
jgi:hypothetical protein